MVKVLVIGINSFVAGPITQQLLEQGHTVVGTLRSLSKGRDLRTQFSQYADRLFLEQVPDITADGCFDHVFKSHPDIVRVAHVASPYRYDYDFKDVDEVIFKPALRGTLAMLNGVHKANQAGITKINRVVVTSSYAAIMQAASDRYPGTPDVNEDLWNPYTRETVPEGDLAIAYTTSKKLAEKAVFDFVNAHPEATFTATTLCIPAVVGPPALPMAFDNLNVTLSLLVPYIDSSAVAKINPWPPSFWIDVRDSAKAHVKALLDLKVGVNKRWLVTAGYISAFEFVEAAHKALPKEYASRVSRGDAAYAQDDLLNRPKLDNSRSNAEMQIEFTPVEKSAADTFKFLIDSKDGK